MPAAAGAVAASPAAAGAAAAASVGTDDTDLTAVCAVHDPARMIRHHLMSQMENARVLAGFRALAILRGIRGEQGVEWATRQMLVERRLQEVLEDTRFAFAGRSLQEAIMILRRAHDDEVQKRVFDGEAVAVANRFSQHKDGRHAGQSGKHWLEAAAAAASADRLAAIIARCLQFLPPLWTPHNDREHEPPPLSDDALLELTHVAWKQWPMPSAGAAGGARTGGDYTAMDVGRLIYITAVADGAIAPATLSKPVFESLMKRQSLHVRQFCAELRFDERDFNHLQAELSQRAAWRRIKKKITSSGKSGPLRLVLVPQLESAAAVGSSS